MQKTSLNMLQETSMFDLQNNGFLILKIYKTIFFRKQVKNKKNCEIKKKLNIVKDCMLNMHKYMQYLNNISIFGSFNSNM